MNGTRIRLQRCSVTVDQFLLVDNKDRQGKPTGKRYVVIQQVKTISGALHLLNKVMGG